MAPLMFLLAALAAQTGGEDAGTEFTDLDQYRWRHRLIVVFAPSPHDERYLNQRASFDSVQESALTERNLLIFSCFPSGGTLEPYAQEPKRQTFSARAAATLRNTFDIEANAFQVVLIGKDGGEKQRSGVPVAAERFLDKIDSMPMRQQEMSKEGD